ncbi:class II fumarate hydratase [Erysipelothrix larvae]|uniref:Class II fumarate hydratase n=1 Tax=Erysipelothrix larvae TaxID=1514105 RepID=A0A0X8H0S6_9FIRM|nr:class II fumarate hydratase [Erysipelothrix larvae]AMC93953.1 class II fumarate hydratase [Erysipelothrix larvae]
MSANHQFESVTLDDTKTWGKNTQRSLNNFPIGTEKMPKDLIKALLEVKYACALSNMTQGILSQEKGNAIMEAIDTLLDTDFMIHFPLSVWQTGSGTQTNMNANEVIAHIGGHGLHPNDDVNKGQSSNDVFPTALHIMTLSMIQNTLLPTLTQCIKTLEELEVQSHALIKTGRTHLQDATPLSFGQEVSAWVSMLNQNKSQIEDSLKYVLDLAIGGTAVGTGLNTYNGFDKDVCDVLNQRLNLNVKPQLNKFHGLSSKDALVNTHNAITTCATNIMKMANDIRWLASGPRTGLGELELPANEAGSSIMPGKVNPTQIEALTMVCVQIMGNNQTMTIANSQGNFQLNVYMPLMGYTLWQSITLLSDSLDSFTKRCLMGLKPITSKMAYNLEHTLMSATALNQTLGYDQTTKLVNEAHEKGLSIKEVVLGHQLMSEEDFDQNLNVKSMIKPYDIKGK